MERLQYSPEGRVWKGPDIATAEPVLIESFKSAEVPVLITPDSLPPLDELSPSRNGLGVSTRSRLAQLGIEVNNFPTESKKELMIVKKSSSSVVVPITVTNHCQRPISLAEGVKIARFYYERTGSSVVGENLKAIFREERLRVDGEMGNDWKFSHKDNDVKGIVDGVFLRVRDKGRRWIVPSKDPINITEQTLEGTEYRKAIDPLFKTIPDLATNQTILWIGETPQVILDEGWEIIMDKRTYKLKGNRMMENQGVQINSRLLDGGKTNWPIRVEILSATKNMPDFVRVRFVKNGSR